MLEVKKNIDINDYAFNNVNWQTFKKIISSLEINDQKLNELYTDAALNIKKFEDEEYRLAYMHAKGKI